MSISPECQRILHRVTTTEREVEQALQQLEAADPGETTNLLKHYRAVTKKLHDLQDSLADCLVDSYQLQVTLTGTATITVEGLAHGSSNISYLFLLNKARTAIALASFPPISLKVSALTFMITQTSGGSGTYSNENGNIVLPLGLHLSTGGQQLDADLSIHSRPIHQARR